MEFGWQQIQRSQRLVRMFTYPNSQVIKLRGWYALSSHEIFVSTEIKIGWNPSSLEYSASLLITRHQGQLQVILVVTLSHFLHLAVLAFIWTPSLV